MSTPTVSIFGGRRRSRRSKSSVPLPAAQDIHTDLDRLPSFQVVIKSFRRFRCLTTLVSSIVKFYPSASIIIADDSFEHPESEMPQIAQEIRSHPNVQWIQRPFNEGLSAGRNAAVQAATADVIIMCDDDYVFTPETRIENLLTVLEHRLDVDVVVGLVRFNAIDSSNWACNLHWSSGQPISASPLNTRWQSTLGVRHRRTDLGLNWYAARRETLLSVPWDNQFKIVMEHIDHFMHLKDAGIHVHYTPDCIVGHEPRSPEDYGNYRMQDIAQYKQSFLAKWSVTSRPGFPMHPEPGIPPIIPDAGKSVIVLGVGHSGTTITTKMLSALGFSTHNSDDEFAENIFVRDLNDECWKTGSLNVPAARRELAFMEQFGSPWVIKDPRFIHTLDRWHGVLAPYRPFLLFVTRDLDDVAESYRRRCESPKTGPVITRGVTLEEGLKEAEDQYDRWPWAKVRITLDQLTSMTSLFESTRP
jgi:GT2 family glycosyltransferase